MSHNATNWAIKQRGISPAAKLVLWHLADRFHPDHGCFPSKDRLAEDCEMSVRSVFNQIEKLVAAGLVIVLQNSGKSSDGKFYSNSYILGCDPLFEQHITKPSAKFADGKNTSLPSANSGKNRRQNLPTNPVRFIKPVREQVREDKSSLVVSVETPICESAEAVANYNKVAKSVGWPSVQKMTPARRSALRMRLKECGGIDGWRQALERAANSNHLTGQNSRGWVASFDFLTNLSSFTKLMEGNYDNRAQITKRNKSSEMATQSFVDENARAAEIAVARATGRAAP